MFIQSCHSFIIPSISNAHRLFDISHFFLDRSPFKKQESKKNKKNKTHTKKRINKCTLTSRLRFAQRTLHDSFVFLIVDALYTVLETTSRISPARSPIKSREILLSNPSPQHRSFLLKKKKIDPHSFLFHHYQHLPPYPTDLEIKNEKNKIKRKINIQQNWIGIDLLSIRFRPPFVADEPPRRCHSRLFSNEIRDTVTAEANSTSIQHDKSGSLSSPPLFFL